MSQRRRRPRAVTLTLPDAQRPYLLLGGAEYMLRNLSEEGIGLWIPSPAPREMVAGAHLVGDIVIGHEIHPIELECVHLADRMVGLRIVHRSEALAKIFRQMLEPAAQAERLVAHPHSGEEDLEQGGMRLWFTAGPETELLVWCASTQRMIVGLQLSCLGAMVSRELAHPPRTGFFDRGTHKLRGAKLTEKDLLLVKDPPDPMLLSQAAQFLASVPQPLPGTLLWQFLETGEQVYLPQNLLFPVGKVG